MRITILFPRLKTFSGAEHLLLELSRRVVDMGHQVTLLTRACDPACRRQLDPRVQLIQPRFASLLTGIQLVDSFFDTALSPLLLFHLPRNSEALCFFCPPVLPALWLYRRILRGHTPVAYYCLQPPRFAYDLMPETISAHRPLGYLVPMVATLYRWMDRAAAPHCDELFAISEAYRRWCEELYHPPSIRIVYPGIDTDLYSHAHPDTIRKQHEIGPEERLVVTVNKLIPRKNIDVFLRAMKKVTNRLENVRGVVVGDGPLKARLRKLHADLGLGNRVFFTGHVEDFMDVISFYAASNVYVFLERNVPFGLTVLEASACGTPVVAVRGGGTWETVIEGETGFLLPETLDADLLAERICWLLAHEEESAAMGQRGIEHARKFHFDATARTFVTALDELACRRQAEPRPRRTR